MSNTNIVVASILRLGMMATTVHSPYKQPWVTTGAATRSYRHYRCRQPWLVPAAESRAVASATCLVLSDRSVIRTESIFVTNQLIHTTQLSGSSPDFRAGTQPKPRRVSCIRVSWKATRSGHWGKQGCAQGGEMTAPLDRKAPLFTCPILALQSRITEQIAPAPAR
jgi:hypothetical protein